MPTNPNSMMDLMNMKMRIILCDQRTFIGTLKAFDKYLNLVLDDATEYKKYKPAKTKETIEVKKKYGVILLRGDNVVSMVAYPPEGRSDRSEHSSHSSDSSRRR